MVTIINEILKHIPNSDELISEVQFEGANIVLYTKDDDFFKDNNGLIKTIVHTIKKRVELRPDPSVCMDMEKTEEYIRKVVPEDSGISSIKFDPPRSIVIIETEKPGLAIGKQGSILRDIKYNTHWVPTVKRTPAIKSNIIDNIRSVLFEHSDHRKKFLNQTGHRIYDGWIREKKNEWVRLTFLGGGRQVGRSCLFLQTPESRILLDCGVDVTSETEAYPYLEVPEFSINELDAVIISHSHTDHCAFLPYLFKFGYRGPVYCTKPTRDVMSLLMLDYVKIMRSEGKDPIYTSDEIKEMVKHTICLDYEEVTDVTPDIRITLYNAGHILGSSLVHLHIGNGLHNLLYTSDMKYGRSMLLDAAHTSFPRLETMIVEATYGGRENVLAPRKETDELLADIIKDTIKRKGKILMPTLGSGRAQEVMILIEHMVRTGELKDMVVYIDGLVWDITAIHTAYPEFLTGSIRKQIFHKDANPFLSPIFKRVGSQKERKEVIEDAGPCVIVATSGMLVGGPSVEYLRKLAEDKRNSLVFSCYQGEGSLGRRIQRGEREIMFKNGNKQELCHIKMEVHRIEITNHSDRKQLMNYLYKVNPKPKKVIINHGENSRCLDLASTIHKSLRIETAAPRNLETLRIK
jgi:uncharacterized protein